MKKFLKTLMVLALIVTSITIPAHAEADDWDGKADTSWYTDAATELTITTAEHLAGLAELVDDGNTFQGKTIKLGNDIDLGSLSFNPIGHSNNGKSFNGTFDGQDHTIYNIYMQNNLDAWQYEGEYYALFAYTNGATIKNLIIADGYISSGRNEAATVAGNAVNTTFIDITVSNTTLIAYNNSAGGVAAECYGNCSFENINVDEGTVIGPLWGTYDVRLGGVVGMVQTGNNVAFSNITVSCKLDAINDVASNYQYWLYRYSGMLIGQVDSVNGVADPTDYITCENVTVNYGDWVNYHYCEDANLGAGSYNAPGEYKFARVEPGTGTDGIDLSACNHNDDESHNVLIVFDQLFGGGQGVSGLKAYDGVTVNYPPVDTTKPTITFTYKGETVKNGDIIDVEAARGLTLEEILEVTAKDDIDEDVVAIDSGNYRYGDSKDDIEANKATNLEKVFDSTRLGKLCQVKYTASDDAGNRATAAIYLRFQDKTKPSMTVEYGGNKIGYKDVISIPETDNLDLSEIITATATDTVDEDVEVGDSGHYRFGVTPEDARNNGKLEREIDSRRIGFWQVKYQAKDDAGNVNILEFYIEITDATKPVITLTHNGEIVNHNDVIEVETNRNLKLEDIITATVTDNFDKEVIVKDSGNYRYGDSVEDIEANKATNLETEFDPTRIGYVQVKYVATDAAGNSAFKAVYIKLKDTTRPTLTLMHDGKEVKNGEFIEVEEAENIDLETIFEAIATDTVDDDVEITETGHYRYGTTIDNMGNLEFEIEGNRLGYWQVKYTAKDDSGNTAYKTVYIKLIGKPQTVNVVIYKNGNTTTSAKTVSLENVRRGETLNISELEINDYYSSSNGYKFEGWYNDGGWNSYKAGNKQNTLGEEIKINGWTNIICMVTDYEKVVVQAVTNGDKDNAETIYNGKALHGTNLIDFLNKIETINEKKGYTLDKWYNWDWYGHKYDETKVIEGWTNVYVTYTANQYKVVYDGNGAKTVNDETEVSQDWTYDVEGTILPGTTFVKEGYTFSGWLNEEGQTVEAGKTTMNLTDKDSAIIKLTAQWTPNKYEVVFYGNGGTTSNGSEKTTSNFTYDKVQALKNASTFVKPGYTFLGWATTADATEAEYSGSEKVSNLTAEPNGEIHLYAVWTPNTTEVVPSSAAYKVIYYLEQLDGSYKSVETTFPLYGELNKEVSAEIKVYENYTFDAKESFATGKVFAPVMTEGATEPTILTLTMYYTLNEHVVSFVDGEDKVTTTHKYGSTYPKAPELEEKEGFEFDGWYNEDDKKVETFPEIVEEDATYTAKWVEKVVTNTGDSNLIVPFVGALVLSAALLVLLKEREKLIK